MARVLIVDDSIIMRRNLKVILSQAGHTVIAEAANGKEALNEYERLKPDVVTMDITMPIMNGIDAVKRIIGSNPEARIIMISALDQRNMVFEALENGAKHYIIKPITPDKVLAVLEAVLNEHEMVVKKEPEMPVRKEEKVPFRIENKDGTFQIRISGRMNNEQYNAIKLAIQGLLFIKPLNILLSFDGENVPDHEMVEFFIPVLEKIKGAGGNIKLHSSNTDDIRELMEMCPDMAINE